ncbi:MBL fold metallo-hydrolase [Terrabacter sp. LjRoot27]|uniref:MBL fold metallo-hydrolase n=1 Tax=Terrabacter sp. LjRoot27 TaxID=3342306 RepID=UPI003ECFA496
MSGLSRRTLLGAATVPALPLAVAPVAPAAATPSPSSSMSPSGSRVPTARPSGLAALTWLGNAGWRIEGTRSVTLVDPYVTRFDTGLSRGAFVATTPLTVDEQAVARHCPRADRILVTHSHWDHVADVPAIAARTGATVFGTRTTGFVARAMGVSATRVVDVRGGEVLDFGDVVVEVVRSLHSRNAKHAILFPGTLTDVPAAPVSIADLPEGDTLSYVVGTPGGPRAYLSGASDADVRALSDLRPDVAAVPVAAADATHDYLPRLLETLDRPRTVVAVHWDDFDAPLGVGERPLDASMGQRLPRFVDEVKRVSPRSTVVVPRHLQRLPL